MTSLTIVISCIILQLFEKYLAFNIQRVELNLGSYTSQKSILRIYQGLTAKII